MKPALFGLIFGCIAAGCLAGTSMVGDWIGKIEISGKPMTLAAHFERKDSALAGTVSLPAEHLDNKPFSSVSLESETIRFELKLADRTMSFQGKLSNRRLEGDFTSGEAKGTFELVRMATVSPGAYRKHFGIYELDANRFLYVRTWDEVGENRLTYFDSAGPIRPLFPISETEYFSGPSLLIPVPAGDEVKFGQKEGVAGLWLKEEDKDARFARRVKPYTEEEVRMKNGDVTLAGTLLIPSTPGKHPAIVMVHGSSSVTRDFFGPIAYDFVRKGIAVLSYDKRGVGASSGHWMDVDYQALATDALAGVQLMKTRKEIDPSRIGLFGISQGGWIAPLAASQSRDVAFLVLVSAPVVNPFEQIVMSQEAELRVMQVPETDISEASTKLRSQLGWLRSDEAFKELDAGLKKMQEQQDPKLSADLSSQGLENPRYLLWLRRVMDYDPLPALQKTTCPVLLVYGELDRTVPFKENKEGLEKALKAAANQHVTSQVFANANHALLRCNTGSGSEFPYLTEFVPGFYDAFTRWILQQSATSNSE